MVWVYKANLRGPRGVQGADGLPGVNAVANDTATAGYVSTTGVSATKTALHNFSAARERATTTVEYKTTGGGVRYSVVRVHTHGKFIPGLVSKEFALDYQTAGTTGVNFKPVRENLDAAQVRLGATAIFNGAGWDEVTNIGEITGGQIRNGVAYHDMTTELKRGGDSLGFFADGSSRIFSRPDLGDSTASMLAAGVVNSFSFGPSIVRAGVSVDLMANVAYAPSYQGELSARQILGQSITGDIVLISVEGVTGSSGIGGNDIPALAVAEGCYNAIVLDGGGSAQSLVNGVYVQPSSDVLRKRPVPDFVVLNTRASSRSFDSGWVPLVLEAGFVANGEVPAIRQTGLGIELRGQVKPTVGSFGNTTVTVAKIPSRFLATSDGVKVFTGNGAGMTWRKILVQTSGNVDVAADTTDVAYVTLHAVRYSLD